MRPCDLEQQRQHPKAEHDPPGGLAEHCAHHDDCNAQKNNPDHAAPPLGSEVVVLELLDVRLGELGIVELGFGRLLLRLALLLSRSLCLERSLSGPWCLWHHALRQL
jgi:hypothetical protein